MERAFASVGDTLANTLIRLEGILIDELTSHWKKKHKEKPPRKLIDAIRKIARPSSDRIKEALADEGQAMQDDLRKRK